MPIYKVTMIKNSTSLVVVYTDKPNAKVAYDDAIIGAAAIFGPPSPTEPHVIHIVEEPAI
jgi:hypothetical protein